MPEKHKIEPHLKLIAEVCKVPELGILDQVNSGAAVISGYAEKIITAEKIAGYLNSRDQERLRESLESGEFPHVMEELFRQCIEKFLVDAPSADVKKQIKEEIKEGKALFPKSNFNDWVKGKKPWSKGWGMLAFDAIYQFIGERTALCKDKGGKYLEKDDLKLPLDQFEFLIRMVLMPEDDGVFKLWRNWAEPGLELRRARQSLRRKASLGLIHNDDEEPAEEVEVGEHIGLQMDLPFDAYVQVFVHENNKLYDFNPALSIGDDFFPRGLAVSLGADRKVGRGNLVFTDLYVVASQCRLKPLWGRKDANQPVPIDEEQFQRFAKEAFSPTNKGLTRLCHLRFKTVSP